MAILLHALAALVLGNLRFASFFERAHSGFRFASRIQPSNALWCNSLLCCKSGGRKRQPIGAALAKIDVECITQWAVSCIDWLHGLTVLTGSKSAERR
jgi:hypothetical protein